MGGEFSGLSLQTTEAEWIVDVQASEGQRGFLVVGEVRVG